MNRRTQKVYLGTWKDVRRFIPGQAHAPAPPMGVSRKTTTGGLMEVTGGRITISRAAAKSLASSNVHRRRMAQYALAHEFAHVYQRPGLNQNQTEGGAEVFARRLGKRLYGLSARDFRPQSYSGAAARFRKRYGVRAAMKDQFRP